MVYNILPFCGLSFHFLDGVLWCTEVFMNNLMGIPVVTLGQRHGLDLMLLWLWRRLAATAPIRPLAWESPYAVSVALEKTKKKKKLTKSSLSGFFRLFVACALASYLRNHFLSQDHEDLPLCFLLRVLYF